MGRKRAFEDPTYPEPTLHMHLKFQKRKTTNGLPRSHYSPFGLRQVPENSSTDKQHVLLNFNLGKFSSCDYFSIFLSKLLHKFPTGQDEIIWGNPQTHEINYLTRRLAEKSVELENTSFYLSQCSVEMKCDDIYTRQSRQTLNSFGKIGVIDSGCFNKTAGCTPAFSEGKVNDRDDPGYSTFRARARLSLLMNWEIRARHGSPSPYGQRACLNSYGLVMQLRV
ncbi:uncharacterized protein EAF02_005428 [Botrytis sinoallii]|uniref:uncharacterized protein n=1 Tax=Botrytis sinoallii TaxID=1463999 RepID=UPI0019004511|nr:uncharacterized protein EAF02_005428 [Botrytis sinoallii]KAF7883508.1 hypothetical protein EAF02_005428 [Botrytis sinoallii]